MNWYRALTSERGVFSHAWSLSIEEQFRLLWPLALLGLRRRGQAVPVLVTFAVGIMFWRVCLSHSASLEPIYKVLDTNADGLLVSCVIALWKERWTGRLWVIPATFLVIVFLTTRFDAEWVFSGYSAITVSSA